MIDSLGRDDGGSYEINTVQQALMQPARRAWPKKDLPKSDEPVSASIEDKSLDKLLKIFEEQTQKQIEQFTKLTDEIKSFNQEVFKQNPSSKKKSLKDAASAGVRPDIKDKTTSMAAGEDKANKVSKGKVKDTTGMGKQPTKVYRTSTKINAPIGITGMESFSVSTENMQDATENLVEATQSIKDAMPERDAMKNVRPHKHPTRYNYETESWETAVEHKGLGGRKYHFFQNDFELNRTHMNPAEHALHNYEFKQAKFQYYDKVRKARMDAGDPEGAEVARKVGGRPIYNKLALTADIYHIVKDAFMRIGNALPGWLAGAFQDDVWRRDIKKTIFQTEGITGEQRGLQDKFLGFPGSGNPLDELSRATGKTLDEVRNSFLKNLRDGYKSRQETLKITRTSLALSNMIGSNMESTAEFFQDMHLHMDLSSHAIAAMSTSMQRIARDSKVTGDALLNAARYVRDIMEDLKASGASSIAKDDSILKLATEFDKMGIAKTGVETLRALQGLHNFNQATDQLKAWVVQGIRGNARLADAIQQNNLIGNKPLMKEFSENLEKGLDQIVRPMLSREQKVNMGLEDVNGRRLRGFEARDVDKLTGNQRMKADMMSRSAFNKGLMDSAQEIQALKKSSMSLESKIASMSREKKAAGFSPEEIQKLEDRMRQEERMIGAGALGDMLKGIDQGKNLDDLIKTYKGTDKFDAMTQSLREQGFGNLNTDMGIKKAIEDSLIQGMTSAGGDVSELKNALASGDRDLLDSAIAGMQMAQDRSNTILQSKTDPWTETLRLMNDITSWLSNISKQIQAFTLAWTPFPIIAGLAILASSSTAIIGLLTAIAGSVGSLATLVGLSPALTATGRFAGKVAGGGWKVAKAVGGKTADIAKTVGQKGLGVAKAVGGKVANMGATPGTPGSSIWSRMFGKGGLARAGGWLQSGVSKISPKAASFLGTRVPTALSTVGSKAGGMLQFLGSKAGGMVQFFKGLGGSAKVARSLRFVGKALGPIAGLIGGVTQSLDSQNLEKTLGKKYEDMDAKESARSRAANWATGAFSTLTTGIVDFIKDLGVKGLEIIGIEVPNWIKNFNLTSALGLGPDGIVTKGIAALLTPVAALGDGFGRLAGWLDTTIGLWSRWTGEFQRGQELDKQQKQMANEQKAAGVFLAKNDALNPKKEVFAKETARDKTVVQNFEQMTMAKDSKNAAEFNKLAEESLKMIAEQSTRTNSQRVDTWTQAIDSINAAKAGGMTMSPQVEALLKELIKKNEIDWMKGNIRQEFVQKGMQIGQGGMTKDVWDQMVNREAEMRYAKKIAVPALADGGIVTQGGLALIGEAGREIVLPQDRLGAMVEPLPNATNRIEMSPVRPTVNPLPLTTVHEQIEQAYASQQYGNNSALAAPELAEISQNSEMHNDKLDQVIRLLSVIANGLSGGESSGSPKRAISTRSNVKPPVTANYYQLQFGIRETPTKGYVNNGM